MSDVNCNQSGVAGCAGAHGSAARSICENCGKEYVSPVAAEKCCWADKEIEVGYIARLKSERDAAWAALVEIVRLGNDAKGRRKSMLGGVSCQMIEVAESALRVVPPNDPSSATRPTKGSI